MISRTTRRIFVWCQRKCSTKTTIPSKVLFFGTDSMSMPALREIVSRGTSLASGLEVVCPEDRVLRVRGKKRIEIAATKQFCMEQGIKFHEIPSKADKLRQKEAWACLREHVRNEEFDLGVVISFGYFLPSSLLKLFPRGAINVHPSLLPKYRGAAPIEHALLNNDKVTGVSIIEVDPSRFDAGHVLSQSKHTIDPSPLFGASELLRELSYLGARDVVDVMEHLDMRRLNAKPQDESNISRAPKIRSEFGQIDWRNMSGEQIFGRFRALSSRTGIYTHFNRSGDCNEQRRVMLRQISLPHHHHHHANSDMKNMKQILQLNSDDDTFFEPGTAVYDKSNQVIWIRCSGNDDWVLCGELQVERKKSLRALDFANGFQFMKRGTSIKFN